MVFQAMKHPQTSITATKDTYVKFSEQMLHSDGKGQHSVFQSLNLGRHHTTSGNAAQHKLQSTGNRESRSAHQLVGFEGEFILDATDG
jgi:hypothetical protein